MSRTKIIDNKIPVVDFSFLSKHKTDKLDLRSPKVRVLSREIHEAFVNYGFVYLVNHGVDSNVIQNAMNESKFFFENTPMEDKLKMQPNISGSTGYIRPSSEVFETEKFKEELRESFDILDFTNSSQFPSGSNFKGSMKSLADETTFLIRNMLDLLSLSLEHPSPNFFRNNHQHLLDDTCKSTTLIRSLYYPPIKGPIDESKVIRCGEHTDYGSLTFLFQDHLGGLEIKSRQTNDWITAQHVPNSILVNIADLMERFSNGLYPATEHRVIIPEQERIREQARQSIAFFIDPDNETVVSPICNTVTSTAPKYQPVKSIDYLTSKFNQYFKKD